MGRRCPPGSLNPRRMWSVPAVWEILCPLIAILPWWRSAALDGPALPGSGATTQLYPHRIVL